MSLPRVNCDRPDRKGSAGSGASAGLPYALSPGPVRGGLGSMRCIFRLFSIAGRHEMMDDGRDIECEPRAGRDDSPSAIVGRDIAPDFRLMDFGYMAVTVTLDRWPHHIPSFALGDSFHGW